MSDSTKKKSVAVVVSSIEATSSSLASDTKNSKSTDVNVVNEICQHCPHGCSWRFICYECISENRAKEIEIREAFTFKTYEMVKKELKSEATIRVLHPDGSPWYQSYLSMIKKNRHLKLIPRDVFVVYFEGSSHGLTIWCNDSSFILNNAHLEKECSDKLWGAVGSICPEYDEFLELKQDISNEDQKRRDRDLIKEIKRVNQLIQTKEYDIRKAQSTLKNLETHHQKLLKEVENAQVKIDQQRKVVADLIELYGKSKADDDDDEDVEE